MSGRSTFIRQVRRVAGGERGGIVARWECGQELLKARAGRQRLPKGYLADRIAEADAAGLTALVVSERELQRWMKFAEVYPTEAHRRQILSLKGTWTAIIEADFPEVEIDEAPEPEDPTEAAFTRSQEWQQPTLIPGFKETVKVHGREVPLAEATVGDVVAYRDAYREMHEGFGKTLAQIEASVEAILSVTRDLDANAAEAYEQAIEGDDL